MIERVRSNISGHVGTVTNRDGGLIYVELDEPQLGEYVEGWTHQRDWTYIQ
jgi:hypothetical protein